MVASIFVLAALVASVAAAPAPAGVTATPGFGPGTAIIGGGGDLNGVNGVLGGGLAGVAGATGNGKLSPTAVGGGIAGNLGPGNIVAGATGSPNPPGGKGCIGGGFAGVGYTQCATL